MKQGVHPPYGDASARCACGNAMTIRSTSPDIKVEACSHCHPAYTGVRKTVSVQGRIERFRSRYQRRDA
jgi:large subunit ribosomal protein L31